MKKRLIICSDGTWQELTSKYPSNVIKIAQAITIVGKDDTPQIMFYDEGLGTGDWRDRLKGGAFGIGLDQNIQDCYRFLCLNYEEGDEIYLFGFSRGAYTVRSLGGFISRFGLLSRENIRKITEAYKYYRLRKTDKDYSQEQKKAEQFRHNHSIFAPITLLGCWDTVGSLGIPDIIPVLPFDKWINRKYKFHDEIVSENVKYALHAVAIDEIRAAFSVTPMQRSAGDSQLLKQVWFPGGHGCVGGGTESTAGLSDRALMWMIEEISNFGLGISFDVSKVSTGVNPNHKINFDNRPKGIFRLGEVKVRKEVEGSGFGSLDKSTIARWQDREDYRPHNLAPYAHQLDEVSEG